MRNPISETLAAGQPSIGSWLNLGSPLAAEVMAAAGFSWLCVDAEHTAYDMESIAHTFRAIEARGAVPLARAWDHDPVTVGRLDAGAYGIVFPHVSTAEQAQRLSEAMRFPRGEFAPQAPAAAPRWDLITDPYSTISCYAYRRLRICRALIMPRPSQA